MIGFFHVCLFNETSIAIYKEIAFALDSSGLAAASKSVEVVVTGKKELYDELTQLPVITNLRYTYAGEDIKQYEYPTLIKLQQVCKDNPEEQVYYIHTKGASQPNSPLKKYWRKAMIKYIIEGWKGCLKFLSQADSVGYNWRTNHFSGNWWFANAKYINTLPSLEELRVNPKMIWHSQSEIDKIRHQPEFWIGMGKPRYISVGASDFDYMKIHPVFNEFDTETDTFEKAGLQVDKKYLINLIRRPDRKEYSLNQIKQAGIKDVLVYPAIDAKTCGWLNSRFTPNPGMAGCYLTHQAILTEAYLNNYEAVVIMEDDVVFSNGFSELFPYIWKGVPKDWELVWIGSTERNGNPNRIVAEQVTIPQDVWGTQCYIVNRKGIEKICNYIWNVPMPDHVDITITRYVPNLIEYAIRPSLADQAKLKSDIAQ